MKDQIKDELGRVEIGNVHKILLRMARHYSLDLGVDGKIL
jgi:hypothetical protein